MKMEEIRKIALKKGVTPGKSKKSDLIHSIQRAEGNKECFETGIADQCGQINCSWRHDCF